MQRRAEVMWGVLAIALCVVAVPAHAQSDGEQPQGASEKRELIYCADLMTHEEREAYRAKMRAARTHEEKMTLRRAHQQEMQARARQRGSDAEQCIPLRQRQRGGRNQ